MNTETQKARNARKRAKLRAKKSTAKLACADKISYTVLEFAVYGRQGPKIDDADEEGMMDPVLFNETLDVGFLISIPIDDEIISGLRLSAIQMVAQRYGFKEECLRASLLYFRSGVVREDFITYEVR